MCMYARGGVEWNGMSWGRVEDIYTAIFQHFEYKLKGRAKVMFQHSKCKSNET